MRSITREAIWTGAFGIGWMVSENAWNWNGPSFFGGALMALAAYVLLRTALEVA